MADSSTPTYGLVLPEVGASADTWGTKCNNNYSDTDALLTVLTTAGGTTAYTLTSGLSLAAYVSGQSFLIKMNATNTGASTLNVDSLGAKNITKNGTTALASGDLVSGTIYRVAYDGTVFQVLGALSGAFQPLDATLTALAALTITATTWIKGTGTDTFAVENASTTRTSLGLGTAATQNTGTSGGNLPLMNGANTWSGVQTYGAESRFGAGGGANTITNTTSIGDGVGWKWGSSTNGAAVYYVYNGSDVGVYLPNGNTAWSASSSRELKNVAGNLTDAEALAAICGLQPVLYTYKSDELNIERAGLIAEDALLHLPKIVSAGPGMPPGIQYGGDAAFAYLVGSVRSLAARIATLEAQS